MILLLPFLLAAARVTEVFPTADVLPANLLRLYVHFSAPMTRRDIARHIHLYEDGQPVENAFLETEEGLWDPEGRRLTVLFHPGRIKRGLAMREAMGPPLRAGHRYRLVIDRDAADENHEPLAADFVKEFTAREEDRVSPDVKRWTIRAPAPDTREALLVTAEKPLDSALFARLLRVEDERGRPIPGEAAVEANETRWRFQPREAWRSGRYQVRVAVELEDLAGNRLDRLFDEPVSTEARTAESHDALIPLRIGR